MKQQNPRPPDKQNHCKRANPEKSTWGTLQIAIQVLIEQRPLTEVQPLRLKATKDLDTLAPLHPLLKMP